MITIMASAKQVPKASWQQAWKVVDGYGSDESIAMLHDKLEASLSDHDHQ